MGAEFLALPLLRSPHVGSRFVVLVGPLVYRDSRGRVWTVPSGTWTDLASVPRWLPVLMRLLFRGPIETAHPAILHDGLYAGVARLDAQGSGHSARALVRRCEGDALFREALRTAGEDESGAWVMWAGVRVGGWVAWRRHRRAAALRAQARWH